MAVTSTDRIEKSVVLRAPRARVWQALTDAAAFGQGLASSSPASSRPVPGSRAGSPTRATSTCRSTSRSSGWNRSGWSPSSATSVVRPEELTAAAPIFAALGDETRLAIVTRLSADATDCELKKERNNARSQDRNT